MLTLTIAEPTSSAPTLPEADGPGVQVWRDNQGVPCAYSHTNGRLHWLHFPNLASFCFSPGVTAVTAFARPSARLDLVRDTFQRSVVPIALQAHGSEALHASAVLAPRGLVVLCATSGTGKSTTAVGLSQRGYPLWADDAVVFTASGRSVVAVPLPFSMRLLPDAASYFERGQHSVVSEPKAEQNPVRPVPLAALCVLERVDGASCGTASVQVGRLSPADAFVGVLAHAYCFDAQDDKRRRRMVQQYLELVARVPVFKVRFKPELPALASVLDRIEQAVTQL
jgi:hypothetical protein